MKIMCIFVGRLYAVREGGEKHHELRRNLNLWTNAEYVFEYLKKRLSGVPLRRIADLADEVLAEAEIWEDFLYDQRLKPTDLDLFFLPLDNLAVDRREMVLSMRKGKSRRSSLRLYALKIEDGVYLVTGGAIKLVHKMKDQAETQMELLKLAKVRGHLISAGVFDLDSLEEYRAED